jgi:hypothetical protein
MMSRFWLFKVVRGNDQGRAHLRGGEIGERKRDQNHLVAFKGGHTPRLRDCARSPKRSRPLLDACDLAATCLKIGDLFS